MKVALTEIAPSEGDFGPPDVGCYEISPKENIRIPKELRNLDEEQLSDQSLEIRSMHS